MKFNDFSYDCKNDIYIFSSGLRLGSPYIARTPRNHESLFYVTKGNLSYENPNGKWIIREGEVGFIPRGFCDKSSAFECEEVSYIAINIGFGSEEKTETDLAFSPTPNQSTQTNYEKLFAKALAAFHSQSAGYLYKCHGLIMQIIGELISDEAFSSENNSHKLEVAIDMIKRNFSITDFRISDLANFVNMSEKNFRRVFKSAYKKTPYAFLQEYRIEQAEFLLKYTSETVTDIAFRCGFSDVYSFSHAFKRINKISPLKFRYSE